MAGAAAEQAAEEVAAPAEGQTSRGKRAAPAGEAAGAPSRRQRMSYTEEDLSCATKEYAWQVVTAFFGEVYVQSCALLINEAPAAEQAWSALSPEQRHSALKLADHLQVPRVLEKWEAFVARDHDLLLADGFQEPCGC